MRERGTRNRARTSVGLALAALTAIAVVAWPGATASRAERVERGAEQIDGIGYDQRLGDRVPRSLALRDHRGVAVHLADYFSGKTPVILTLNYSSCPMLCSLQLTGLVESLSDVTLDLGDDYRIVTVSIDPTETSQTASRTRARYIGELGLGELGVESAASAAWDFLVGDEEAIRTLAAAVGFRYQRAPATGEYIHPAVTMICTPDGRLSRYLGGVQLDPTTLRLSLVEASGGGIGTPFDAVLLTCFRYDPNAGSYVFAAMGLMKAGGVAIVLALAVFFFVVIRRELRATKQIEAKERGEQAVALEGGRTQ